ncbi:bile acid:sodium symporter family protein [Lentzea aerocolonigenes]|uniref:bile acid:sodium symporter family protein n=1 Tax=Lentzea aerocolonigenes TaxID=68170 RepID=UPI0004C3B7DD|nr:bile acid:sodium symporter family protein [Lentzea aerocolonigenes]MCP2244947.1 bile acid:Na+ symporter, BASS family [Lentzea aerocolonigenes]
MLVAQIFLPVALGLVMFGLGLTLTTADFARVAKYPKAAAIGLACQMIVLPAICVGLVLAFGIKGVLAVGMMLLVASPGGASANLFSHLAGGNVALNITLTAINSVLAVFTLPLVVGLSTSYFLGDQAALGLQPAKFLQVFAIVLVPVAIGMWVRSRYEAWALKMNNPVRIASVVVLVLVIVAAIVTGFQQLVDNVATLGPVALLLSVLSLTVGYFVPKAFKVERDQAIASAMEIGIHNATIAITLALTVLNDEAMAIPAAVYGVLMYLPAAVAVRLLSRNQKRLHTQLG